jgi:hypothetical protein
MRMTSISILLVLSALAFVGCGGEEPPPPAAAPPIDGTATLPADHPPIDSGSPGSLLPPPPGTGTGTAALTWTVPSNWSEEQASSSVRRAQYYVPGPGGDAEMVVFYFGPGQGGDPMSNAARWANQFTQPDGSSSMDKMKTREQTVAGMSVLRVEIDGHYQNAMTGGPMIENARLLGAIVSGPDSNWFFKLAGPDATVEDQRDEFESLVASLTPGA